MEAAEACMTVTEAKVERGDLVGALPLASKIPPNIKFTKNARSLSFGLSGRCCLLSLVLYPDANLLRLHCDICRRSVVHYSKHTTKSVLSLHLAEWVLHLSGAMSVLVHVLVQLSNSQSVCPFSKQCH